MTKLDLGANAQYNVVYAPAVGFFIKKPTIRKRGDKISLRVSDIIYLVNSVLTTPGWRETDNILGYNLANDLLKNILHNLEYPYAILGT